MKRNLSLLSVALLAALLSCNTDNLQPSQPISPPQTAAGRPGSTPDDDVISVYKKTRVSWADTDYQEADFDAGQTPVRYTRQNLYAQGTNQVRNVVYDLIHTDGRLTRVDASNGTYVTYSYADSAVSRTQEFAANGRLLTTWTYTYFPDRRLKRIDETPGEGSRAEESSRLFSYDSDGNLSQITNAVRDARTGMYRIHLVVRYADYDAHKNVSGLWALHPLLPGVTLQINNPGSVTSYAVRPDGRKTLLQRMDYRYAYDEQGRPVAHTQTGPGGTLRATYRYLGY